MTVDEMEAVRGKIDQVIAAMIVRAKATQYTRQQFEFAYARAHKEGLPENIKDPSKGVFWEWMFGFANNARHYLRRGGPEVELSAIQLRHVRAIKDTLLHLRAPIDRLELSSDPATWIFFLDRVLEVIARPPPLFRVPFRDPPHFMGRDEVLEKIDSVLRRGDSRAVIAALYGLRGVGKTVLAAAYAHRHRDDYHAVMWISAHDDLSLRSDIASLGERMTWVKEGLSQNDAVEVTLSKLAESSEAILLIFDNAPDEGALRGYLPAGGNCKCLITSNSPIWGEVATPIELPSWRPEVGAKYLMARANSNVDQEGAVSLSEALGGLPLALSQAGAYCETVKVTFTEYLTRYEARKRSFLDDNQYASPAYREGLTVARTFDLAIDEATKRHPAADSLVAHASLLGPEPIPLILFREVPEAFVNELGVALAAGQLEEVVTALRMLSLVDRESVVDGLDRSAATDVLLIHRLVREIAAVRLPGDRLEAAWRAVFIAVARTYPADANTNPKSWRQCRYLTPHVNALWSTDKQVYATREDWAVVLDRVGQYYRASALLDHAERVVRLSMTLNEEVYGKVHPITARSYTHLALLHEDAGNLDTAFGLMDAARAIFELTLEPDHPQLAEILEGLGSVLGLQGRSAEGVPFIERALAVKEKILGEDDLSTAQCLTNLASLLKDIGEYERAMHLYQRALAICEQKDAPDRLRTAALFNSIGNLYYRIGDAPTAVPLFQQSLQIEESTYGTVHPHLAPTLGNLGLALLDQGRLDEARECLNRALVISSDNFGMEDYRTGRAYENLAGLLWAQGDARWRSILLFASMVYAKAFGPNHQDTLRVLRQRKWLRVRWYAWLYSRSALLTAALVLGAWFVWRSRD